MNHYKRFDIILLSLVIILFYVLNNLIPYCWDDFGYTFMCVGRNHDFNHPILSFSDAFWSQVDHYQHNTGRFLIHIAVQLLCGIGNKTYFNFLITLIATGWIYLLFKLCFPEKKFLTNIPTALFLTLLFALLNTGQGAFYTGVAFGMNYLYGTFICMLYLFLYETLSCKNVLQKIILCFVGFLAGWSHELIAIGVGAYILTSLILNHKKNQRFRFISTIFFYIGIVFLIFAPGNFVRQSEHNIGFSIIYLIPFIALFFIVAFILWYRKRNLAKKFAFENLPYITAWGVLILFFVVLRIHIYGRMLVGVQLFGFILIIHLADKLGFYKYIYKLRYWGALLCICFLFTIVCYQITPSKQMKEFYSLCEDPNISQVNYVFHQQYCPPFINRYIFRFKNEEYWDPLYSERYNKQINMTVVTE